MNIFKKIWSFFKKAPVPKKTFKDVLGQIIFSLENDIINYNWVEQGSCNCGIIVQALSGLNETETKSMFQSEFKRWVEPKTDHTWKNLLKASCSVTGEPMTKIFKELQSLGLHPVDIAHLEYLSNPAILKKSSIDVKEQDYYRKKSNLILYLKSWLKILNSEPETSTETTPTVEQLEEKLLVAVANEDYPTAANLRDQLALINK